MALREWLGLDGFNALSDRTAMHALYECCSSPIWARRVAMRRPFDSREALFERADRVLAEIPEAEIDHALDGHPRIGGKVDNNSSQREQAGVASADRAILDRLADGNQQYEQKFGHVYLVCATGKSADELLGILEDRMDNDAETERRVMRAELQKINRIRLDRMLGEDKAR